MKINYEFVKRKIAGEDFLVPIGEGALKYKGMFSLTEVAGFIWDMLSETEDEKEIVKKICEEYEVSEETATEDTREFLQVLREMGILE